MVINPKKIESFILYTCAVILLFNGHFESDTLVQFDISNKIAYSFIALLIACGIFLNREIFLDEISIIMIARCVLTAIAIFVNYRNLGKLSVYLTVCVQLLIYLFLLNSDIEQKSFFNLCRFTFGVCCIQTLSRGLLKLIRGDYLKVDLVIPIGASNYIGCIITLMMIIIVLGETKEFLSILYLILWTAAMIVTQSSSGFVVGGIFVIYYIFHMARKNKVFFLLAMLLLCMLACVFHTRLVNICKELLTTIFYRFSNVLNGIFSANGEQIEHAFNGRFQLWKSAWIMITEKPILGYGSNYTDVIGGSSHNLFFDTLMMGGVANLFLLIAAFMMIITRLVRNLEQEKWNKIALIALMIGLLQGQVEPNFQGFSYSLFFFALLGLVNRRKDLNVSFNNYEAKSICEDGR